MSERITEAIQNAAEQKAMLFENLQQNPDGWIWCQKLTAIYDELWRELWREARTLFPTLPSLSIVATGGYGRQEMSPHSDVDVAFVPASESPELETAIRWLFRTAHDAFGKTLGVRLSYVYRLIGDLPGLDSISLSNLLDARHVAGSSSPYQKLTGAMWDSFPTSDFLYAKLEERRTECAKTHETPLVTQPHLKFGAGGLRDFHCSNWIGLAIGERAIPITPEVNFLLKIRNLLHVTAGKMQDELNFARREELGHILGMDSLEFGASVVGAMSMNHEQFLIGLKRLTESRYSLGEFAQAARGEVRISPGSPSGITAVMLADAVRIGLDLPTELPPLQNETGPEVAYALGSGAKTLRELERTGIFSLIFPEFARCKTLMPRDASHQYSVQEHTLLALEEFENIPETSPFAGIKASLSDPTATTFALLFHDLGKAIPEGSHSDTGASIASEVCHRWNLDDALISAVTWLVREHLTMSQYIRLRDIDHPDTVSEFAQLFPDLELLKALTLITYCDVRSVSPELWTPVQETYLLALYERATNLLESQFPIQTSESMALERVLKTAEKTGTAPVQDLEDFLNIMPAHYLLSSSEEIIFHHYQLFSNIEEKSVVVEFKDHRNLQLTEITVAMRDRSGILLDILGTLYAHNLSMQNLRCSTSESKPAGIIDTFMVSKAGAPIPLQQRAQIESDLKGVLLKEISLDDLMRKRGKDPNRPQQFFTLEILDREPVILEIRAPRGRGLAYRLSRTISEQGLSILSARLGQWAGSASAAFYVVDPTGEPININKLRDAFFLTS